MKPAVNSGIWFRACRLSDIVACVAMASMLSGCEQRELCYDHSSHKASVNLEFDWSDAPDADPASMVVYFFPTDNTQYIRFEFDNDGSQSRNGFSTSVSIPIGTYNVVCHNGGNENMEEGNTYHNYRLTSFDTDILSPINRSMDAPKPDNTESQPVRAQASTLYACTISDPVSLTPNSANTIVLRPQKKSTTINVTISDIKNMKEGVEFCGVISGLAEYWHPSSGMPGGSEVIVPVSLSYDGEKLHGSMEVFGDKTPHDTEHKLRLYTSQKYFYDFDVTDQIHSASGSNHVDISVSGVVLPGDQGMDVSVDSWENAETIFLVDM